MHVDKQLKPEQLKEPIAMYDCDQHLTLKAQGPLKWSKKYVNMRFCSKMISNASLSECLQCKHIKLDIKIIANLY